MSRQPQVDLERSASPTVAHLAASRFLHVVVLVALAVATPLAELLRRFPEFLWSHGIGAAGVLALVAGLLCVLPLPLLLLPAIERARRRPPGLLTLIAVALPSAVLALQGLVGMGVTGWGAPVGAVALGASAGLLYVRWRRLRTYVGLLVLVALVAPARLVWSVATAGGSGEVGEVELGRTGNRAPIVVVIFDELPMISLLIEGERWDTRNFPNFARLAATSHSFLRARSVSTATLVALPAMLTGERPKRRQPPTLESFPRNLFTLFGGDHRVWAVEPATELCPASINEWSDPAAAVDPAALASDLWILWRSVTWPAPWAEDLPETGSTWRDFGAAEGEESAPDELAPEGELDDFDRHYARLRTGSTVKQAARGDLFRRFVAELGSADPRTGEPELHFLHTMLPHAPLIYLPSGMRYSDGERPRTLGRGVTWSDEPEIVASAYQRHMLQVRYTDRLLGELLDRLEATAHFDRSLIVVTADHGASFRTGVARRGVGGAGPAENLWVPLLVKAPGQRHPEIHRRPVATTSMVPTMLDLLDIEAPWRLAARSALDPEAPPLRELSADEVEAAFAWKRAIFGKEVRVDPPLRISRNADLIGREIDSLPIADEVTVELLTLKPGSTLEDRPETGARPVWVRGSLRRRRSADCCEVAYAVNGRIVAVGRTLASASERLVRFQVLLPESSLQPGANLLEVFVVAESAGERRLLAPRRRGAAAAAGEGR